MKKLFILAGVLFAILPFGVHANAFSLPFEGARISPIGDTDPRVLTTNTIEMVSEDVTIEVKMLDSSTSYYVKDTEGYLTFRSKAHVKETYVLNNAGTEQQDFQMGMPLGNGVLLDRDQGTEGATATTTWEALRNLQVAVDGASITTQTIDVARRSVESSATQDVDAWSAWTVDFGAKGSNTAKRTILVEYDMYPSDGGYSAAWSYYNPMFSGMDVVNSRYYYLVSSGRGWKGPIGSSNITMKFPESISLVQEAYEGNRTCVEAECEATRVNRWSVWPTDYTTQSTSNILVWKRENWEPKPFESYLDDRYDGDDFVVEFMYPKTREAFQAKFTLASTQNLSELSKPYAYGEREDNSEDADREAVSGGTSSAGGDQNNSALMLGLLALVVIAVGALAWYGSRMRVPQA